MKSSIKKMGIAEKILHIIIMKLRAQEICKQKKKKNQKSSLFQRRKSEGKEVRFLCVGGRLTPPTECHETRQEGPFRFVGQHLDQKRR